MFVRRAFVLAAVAIVAAGCTTTPATAPSDSDAPAGQAPLPTTGIAVQFGNSATSNTKTANVFDTARHMLLGRFSAAAPGPHTQLGPVVVAPDGRHVFITAYDTIDTTRTRAGVYEVDLQSSTARYVKSLGPGTPVDATLASGVLLQVIVSDNSPEDPNPTNRVVTIDTSTGTVESSNDPLPRRADGTMPAPMSIVYDPARRLTYLTDLGGTIYAFRPPMRYYRQLPGPTSLFSAMGASVALDDRRSVLYQLGTYATVDARGRTTTSGALLATALRSGATHLATFPYIPARGATLDRGGRSIYFGSTYATSPDRLYVSRYDVVAARYVSRPITEGRPEFLNTGKLAFSSDGAHLLMPVSTGADATLAGAMLEIDPSNLAVQSSAVSPDAFESGGVVAM